VNKLCGQAKGGCRWRLEKKCLHWALMRGDWLLAKAGVEHVRLFRPKVQASKRVVLAGRQVRGGHLLDPLLDVLDQEAARA